MRKTLAIIGTLLLLAPQLPAQEGTNGKKRPQFHSYNSIGIIAGDRDTEPLLQSVNGIRFPRWFIGAGVGIDAYRIRSVPLFVDGRLFLLRKQQLFVYADAGVHVPWVAKRDANFNPAPTYSKGLYYDGGFGYQLPFGVRNAIVLSAGFTEKRHAEETKSTNPCLFPPCPEYINRYDYKLKRLAFKFGVMF